MTPLQHKIYGFIRQYTLEQGYAPSLAEIAQGIGISPKSVSLISRNIHALAEAGELKLGAKGYRNIEIVGGGEAGLTLPLMGRIAAGTPIEAIESKQEIDLTGMLQGNDNYMLQVKGDSMIDEGIFDGDLVICRQANQAREGDIVVALIERQEATLKRISYKIRDRITLIPANPTLKPKAYLPQHVQVQGIFVGLLRLKM